ncbi:MAG: hypothetical protein SOV71_02070 [Anaerovoracaceae bacterium]|nr:hypothetical protein [Bacillota bacterium]MDY2670328.1 hypothetical protein [Anaerovoracaceae bacterium]
MTENRILSEKPGDTVFLRSLALDIDSSLVYTGKMKKTGTWSDHNAE